MEYTRAEILEKLKNEYGRQLSGVRVNQIISTIGKEGQDYRKVHARLIIYTQSGFRKLLNALNLKYDEK